MKQLPFLNDGAGRSSAAKSSTSVATPATATPATAAPATATPAGANPRRPAIIVPLQATAPEEIARQCSDIADTGVVDVIEWRIDPVIAACLNSGEGDPENPRATDLQTLAEAVLGLAVHVARAGLPVLITLRTGFEGGNAEVDEDAYADILAALIAGWSGHAGQVSGEAPTFDVEIDRKAAADLIDRAHEHGMAVVASHHNFGATDSADSLLATFARMDAAGADAAKVAMMPQSHADVAELLRAIAQAETALETPVLGISMGQLGRTSRVMGADFGSCASFAQLGESSAPGQIAVADLAGIFDRLYG